MKEPIAWVWEMEGKRHVDFKNWLPEQLGIPSTPLYAEPEQLSDEEIIKIWGTASIWDDYVLQFAKDLLKRVKE